MSMLVAIDGPAGAGKSTVARRIGEQLSLPYVDTGAMYRCVALIAKETELPLTNEALAPVAASMPLRFVPALEGQRLFLHEREVTTAIRTAEIGVLVPSVAKLPGVRAQMLTAQRAMAIAEPAGVVMDGRDIGTHVIPGADVKIYLTATLEARAKRRHVELLQQGYNGELSEVMKVLHERDELDGRRAVAPMRPAKDAVLIDTTPLLINEVVAMIVALCLVRQQVKEAMTRLHV